MDPLFARIRWRLVGWTMLSVGLVLLVLGIAVYAVVQRSLMDQVDRSLLDSSNQAVPSLGPGPGPGLGPGPVPNGNPGAGQGDHRLQGRDGFRGGVFFLVVSPANVIFDNPQQVQMDPDDVPTVTGQAMVLTTVTLDDGSPTRLLVRAMPDGDRLVVGQSLASVVSALGTLAIVLLGGAGIGLVLLLGAAWFLAGRALVPIHQAFRRQQEFVADASHELRTPLTVLQSSVEIMDHHSQEPLAANQELWTDMRHEIDRMVRLTRDLLTLARSDRGELELLTGPVELNSLAGDVVRRARAMAQDHGVDLSLVEPEAGSGFNIEVEADPDRLEQVVLILLDNAVKHTPAGGNVQVQVHRQGGYAALDVVDTGEGIAPEHLARIFDRFYRVDSARSAEQGGTGLGLAIARMLVEAHHGHLLLTSTLGVGTRVSVRLPVQHAAHSIGERLAAHLTVSH